MHWTQQHDEIFVKEILLFEPWRYKKGSVERGNAWKSIAESLSQMKEIYFRVDDRSVRDRYNLLEKKFKSKRNQEEKASGIEIPEETETEKGLADIIDLFQDSDTKHMEEKDKKKETIEKEVTQAEEFRRQSLETLGESKRRNNEETGCPSKRRRSDDTIEYLREKSKQEQEMRTKEMELKKAELDDRREESKTFREMLLQQQQNTAALMQQQQQVNIALLQFLGQQNKQ